MQDQIISHFQIFDQLDLSKSVASIKGSGTKDDPYTECYVEGRVLNMVKDISNERPIVPLMDWTYFDQQGFVKAEHDPTTTEIDKSKGTVKITHIPTFSNHIGIPVERKRTADGKGEFIKAGLFANLEKAQEVIKLMKALDEWNRRHPDNPRTMGWSIEGDYLKKSNDGDYVGRVYNIVLSTNPQDVTTYAQLVTNRNLSLAKSLEAGYETVPTKKVGGGALRRESLEGAKNLNQSQKEKKIMFKSEYDAYKHCLSKGMEKEKAKAEAKKLWQEQKAKQKTDDGEVEKSVGTLQELCKSAITSVEAFVNIIKAPSEELVAFDNKLKKSVQQAKNGEADQIDGILAFLEHGQLVLDSRQEQRSYATELSKGILAVLKNQEAIAGLMKSIVEISTEAREQAAESTDRVTRLIVGLQKSRNMLSTDVSVLATQEPDKTPAGTPQEILKSVTGYKIENYLINKGANAVNEQEGARYFRLQSEFRQRGLAAIPAEIQADMAKVLAPATE